MSMKMPSEAIFMTEAHQSPRRFKVQIVPLGARIVTLLSLVVSFVLMRTNNYNIADSYVFKTHYHDVRSYRYMVGITLVGLAYTLLQTPFAVYFAIRGKRLINHTGLLTFDYYGDKVNSYAILSGVAATFGFTADAKKSIDDWDNILRQYGHNDLSSDRKNLDSFYNMAFISGSFLLLGFISSGVSSILSSRPVSKQEDN
ncbi:unnamed protein product [Camellia sinensis]